MKTAVWFSSLLAASFALAHVHPFGDAHRSVQVPRERLLRGAPIPESVRHILVEKCADCHSSATRWPVYSRLAPISWAIEHDVLEGRRHLDFSNWDEMPRERMPNLEQEIAHQARSGAMPPLLYRLVHWHAALEPRDRLALADLAFAGTNPSGPPMTGDAERGRAVFARRCTGCHAVDSDREGPHLRGVFGRLAGSEPDFKYSAALRRAGVTWTDANLEKWLMDSDAMIPGTAMGFSVPKPQERADLIAFLRTLR